MNYSQKANPNASDSELDAKKVISKESPREENIPYLYSQILEYYEWEKKHGYG
tara:strand:- start:1377 stop:1535 length:159 start_codon:yes stop_codon:yes gene_type:complete